MEVDNPQDEVLAWLSQTTPDERKDFLLAAIATLRYEEIKPVTRGIEHALKRLKRRRGGFSSVPKLRKYAAPVPAESSVPKLVPYVKPVPAKSTYAAIPSSFADEFSNLQPSAPVPGEVPVTVPEEVPAPVPGEVPATVPEEVPGILNFSLESAVTPLQEAWYAPWLKDTSTIVAIDCEMVQIKGCTSTLAHQCATVCLVDFFGSVILQRTVKHTPGSFVVNKWTQKVNGFTSKSLQNGMPLKDVTTEVEKLLQEKLVITVDAEMDFRCLGLAVGNFENFDLHQHWKQWDGCYKKKTFPPEKSYQRISLRRLYKHYFNEDIQDGVHSAVKDAAATMKLFRNYLDIKKTNLRSKFHDDYDDFNVIAKISN